MSRVPAGRSPSSALFGSGALSRRTMLRGSALGVSAVAVSNLLAACGDSDTGSGGSGDTGAKEVSFGSNYSDPVPKGALESVLKAYESKSSKTVKINTVDHNSFQENITRYLQGNPEDVFTWFAGFRMQYFAAQGFATDLSDVWKDIGGNYSDAFKKASTGADGKQYFVPFYNYPWAVFYRKSVFQQRGYAIPKTFDEFKTLAAKMKTDGITPISFADKDGWPAMGTFDYINMRTNGYDFHVSLMAGKESWTDPKVKQVFDNWKSLLPFYQEGALGRTWQEGAQQLQQKKCGMYVLGSFVGQQFTGEDKADLDFFAFPEINSQYGQDAVEAPIDGFMISKKAKNVAGAKDLLRYLATPEAQLAYLKSDPNNVAANKSADTSGYSALQKKASELISGAKSISQFLDRDTRPDFASTVMIPSLQQFLNNPNDVDGLLKNIESQKKTIFAS
jgi:multiple sugar transport system substrate-binding protein